MWQSLDQAIRPKASAPPVGLYPWVLYHQAAGLHRRHYGVRCVLRQLEIQ